MKILIIEDELPAAKRLQRLIRAIDENIDVAGVLGSVEETVNWFQSNPMPDLVFMDVQLEDGNCFEIFEQVNLNTPVIFTTAYDQYALRAFKVNSVDYLLKPVSRESLQTALEKYRTVFEAEFRQKQLRTLIDQLKPAFKERFLVRVGEKFRSVPVDTITCFYVREKYNFLLTRDGINYGIDLTLDRIEQVVDPVRFFRVNRKYIISFSAISEVIAYSGSRLKIVLNNWKDGEDIIVSRERVSEFKRWMDR